MMQAPARRVWLPWVLAALYLATPLVVTSGYLRGVLALAAIYAVLALSMDVLIGYSGQVSFGHAAFFGIGAYTVGIVGARTRLPFIVALACGMAIAMVLGALIGLLALRISGVYFAIATLAVAEILRIASLNLIEITRGSLGLSVADIWLPVLGGTSSRLKYFLVSGVVLVLVLYGLRRVVDGPLGVHMKAVRESLVLAESVGVPIFYTKVSALVLSAALAALAGAMYAPFVGVLTPGVFGPHFTAIALLSVLLGGQGRLYGAVAGAAVFALAPELLRAAAEYRLVVFGVLLVVMVAFVPGGLAATLDRLKARGKPDRPDGPMTGDESAGAVEEVSRAQ